MGGPCTEYTYFKFTSSDRSTCPFADTTTADSSMSSSHVPSKALLRCLSRLTRGPRISPSVPYCRKQRLFSCTTRCAAQQSSQVRSPRAGKATVRGLGVSFASTYFDRPKDLKELDEDVLYNIWVKKDFEDLGLHYIPGFSSLPPDAVVAMVLHNMKSGWTPQKIAEWFSQTNPDIDNPNDGE